MNYINAATILPAHLLAELQQYIQSGYLYIPAPKEQHKGWGERSGIRKELTIRNGKIIAAYHCGVSVTELAGRYFLSEHAIKKIIYQKLR